jgi:hypothetical protein
MRFSDGHGPGLAGARRELGTAALSSGGDAWRAELG